MKRKHWTHRAPRRAAKWLLAYVIVTVLPVGCSDLRSAGQMLDGTAQVCRIIDDIRQCTQG
nr:hypothetical protein [Cronobacter malonaticus]